MVCNPRRAWKVIWHLTSWFHFEVDLATLTYKNIGDSYGGSAFCLSACTRKPLLVVGSEDGAARLFSYENDSLDYVKSLPTIGVRILSIGFHPSMPRIFMGCSDGTIRCVEEVRMYLHRVLVLTSPPVVVLTSPPCFFCVCMVRIRAAAFLG